MPRARILIIDDDPTIHSAVERRLDSEAIAVQHATEPEDGLRLAMTECPDVILLDINMPRMDGLKVCRHLKEAETTRDTPILFLTVDANMGNLARALDCGGTDYILKPFNSLDLVARVRVALRTKRMIDLLKEQARIDALTGLPNRAALDAGLEAATAAYARTGQPFALLLLDVDHFKNVNDDHGHGVGDELLRAAGAALHGCCRPYDLPTRYGGDEFAIILGHVDEDAVESAALRILNELRGALVEWSQNHVRCTCSAGLVHASQLRADFSPADALKTADKALYEAKQSGRDRLCFPPETAL